MTTFYRNYAKLCAKANKSLSAVAEEIGLSRTSPNGWKKDKVPRDSTLYKLANYFGVTVEDLLSEDESKPAPDQGNELTEVQREALAVIQEMSDDQLRVFIAAMKAARGKD